MQFCVQKRILRIIDTMTLSQSINNQVKKLFKSERDALTSGGINVSIEI